MNYNYEAKRILEEFTDSYSEVDVDKLARTLKRISKEATQEVYAIIGHNEKLKKEKNMSTQEEKRGQKVDTV